MNERMDGTNGFWDYILRVHRCTIWDVRVGGIRG